MTRLNGSLTRVSIVIPVHNEEEILKKSLDGLVDYCKKHSIDPEILICENGSKDKTKEILRRYNNPKVKKLFLTTRGLGAAYKQGIMAATTNKIYFTGIDFPFGYRNLTDSLAYLDKYDIVFSSKAHPRSIIHAPFLRKIVSFVFRAIVRLMLPTKVNDPQGCLTAKSPALKDIAQFCDSEDAFFQTQTALYANLLGYPTAEIPVNYLNPRFGSKFSIRKDSPKIFRQILEERRRYPQKLAAVGRSKGKEAEANEAI